MIGHLRSEHLLSFVMSTFFNYDTAKLGHYTLGSSRFYQLYLLNKLNQSKI